MMMLTSRGGGDFRQRRRHDVDSEEKILNKHLMERPQNNNTLKTTTTAPAFSNGDDRIRRRHRSSPSSSSPSSRKKSTIFATLFLLLVASSWPLLFFASLSSSLELSATPQMQLFSGTQNSIEESLFRPTAADSHTASASQQQSPSQYFQFTRPNYATSIREGGGGGTAATAVDNAMMGMWLPITTTTMAQLSATTDNSATSFVTFNLPPPNNQLVQIRFKILNNYNGTNGCAGINVRELFRPVPIIRGNFCFLSLQTKSLQAQKRLNREVCDMFNFTIKSVVTMPRAHQHQQLTPSNSNSNDEFADLYQNYYETPPSPNWKSSGDDDDPSNTSHQQPNLVSKKTKRVKKPTSPDNTNHFFDAAANNTSNKLAAYKKRTGGHQRRRGGARRHQHTSKMNKKTKFLSPQIFFNDDEKNSVDTINRQKRRAPTNVNVVTTESITRISVQILDENEAYPLFDTQHVSYEYEVDENVPLFTRVARVHAGDSDAGLNGNVYYTQGEECSSPASSVPSSWYFAVDSHSGTLYTVRRLDADARAFFCFFVAASDRGRRQHLTSRQQVQIHVIRKNLHKPDIVIDTLHALTLQQNYFFPTSREHGTVNTYESKTTVVPVGLVTVSDADVGSHGFIESVEIIQSNFSSSSAAAVGSCPPMQLVRRSAVDGVDEENLPSGGFKREKFYIVANIYKWPVSTASSQLFDDDHEKSKIWPMSTTDNDHSPTTTKFCTVAISAVDTGYPPLTTQSSIEIPLENFRRQNLYFFTPSAVGAKTEESEKYAISVGFTRAVYEAALYECAAPFGPFVQVQLELLNSGRKIVDDDLVMSNLLFSIFDDENEHDGGEANKIFTVKNNGWIELKTSMLQSNVIRHQSDYEFGVQVFEFSENRRIILARTRVRLEILDCNDNRPQFASSSPSTVLRRYDDNIWLDSAEKIILAKNSAERILVYTAQANDADAGENAYVAYSLANVYPNTSTADGLLFEVNDFTGQVYFYPEKINFNQQQQKQQYYTLAIDAIDWGRPCRQKSTLLLNATISFSSSVGGHGSSSISFPTLSSIIQDLRRSNTPTARKSPKSPKSPITIFLSESTPVGTLVPIFNTTHDEEDVCDADGSLKVYSLESSDNSSYFRLRSIFSSSNALELLQPLDYEKQAKISLKIFSNKIGGRSSLHDDDERQEQEILIRVGNENDCAPQFAQTHYNFHISESSSNKTTVLGQIRAVDDDDDNSSSNVTYSLSQSNEAFFEINSKNGILRLQARGARLDRERAAQHKFWIYASDGLHTTRVTCVVHVDDVNDSPPRFAQNFDRVLLQNDLPVNSVVYVATAHDADVGRNAQITYEIVDNERQRRPRSRRATFSTFSNRRREIATEPMAAAALFEIDAISGCIRTIRPLTTESKSVTQINLTIIARDRGTFPSQLSSTMQLLIIITPVMEESSACSEQETQMEIFGKNSYPTASVQENSPIGTLLTFDSPPTDASEAVYDYAIDGSDSVYFRIVDGQKNSAPRISTATIFDRETRDSYWIRLLAGSSSGGGVGGCYSASAWLFVRIQNVDDNLPLAQEPIYQFFVQENLPPNTFVGRILAADADGDDDNISYEISSGLSRRYFHIDRANGSLYTSMPLDREAIARHSLQIQLRSLELQSTVYVTVNVLDVNDNPPILLHDDDSTIELPFQLVEGGELPPPFPVYRFLASDADETQNAEHSFSVSTAMETASANNNEKAPLVKINEHTGELYFTKALVRYFSLELQQTNSALRDTSNELQISKPLTLPLIVRVKASQQPQQNQQHKDRQKFLLKFVPVDDVGYVSDLEIRPNIYCQIGRSLAVQLKPICSIIENSSSSSRQPQQRRYWFFMARNDDQARFTVGLTGSGEISLARNLLASEGQNTTLKSTLLVHVTDGRLWANTTVYVDILPDEVLLQPKFVDKLVTVTIDENANAGTIVTQLKLQQPSWSQIHNSNDEYLSAQQYEFVLTPQSIDDDKLRIDPTTGIITLVAASLDREETKQFSLTALVRRRQDLQEESSYNDYCKILISVNDINEHAPVFIGATTTDGGATIHMWTEIGGGATVGWLHAVDADYGPNAHVSFELLATSSAASLFGVESFSGRVFLRRALTLDDFSENVDDAHDDGGVVYTLKVRASDDGRPEPLSSTATLKIHVRLPAPTTASLESLLPPTLPLSMKRVFLKENQPSGFLLAALPQALSMPLALLRERDADYSIKIISENFAEKKIEDFVTLTPSGAILTNKPLDYEQIKQVELQFALMENDQLVKISANLTVFIVNINDNAPKFIKTDELSGIISESAVPDSPVFDGAAKPLQLGVADADNLTDLFEYHIERVEILSQSGGGDFSALALRLFYVDSVGVIRVAANANGTSWLDYEKIQRVKLFVSASDGVFSTPTLASVVVDIGYVNDEPPIFYAESKKYRFYVPKLLLTTPGYHIGSVEAHDADSTKLYYSIAAPYDEVMEINALGDLFLKQEAAAQLKNRTEINFTVVANDGIHSSSQRATLLLLDNTNSNGLYFEHDIYDVTLTEEQVLATAKILTRPKLVDRTSHEAHSATFRLITPHRAFVINTVSGAVLAKANVSVDREVESSATLLVEAITRTNRRAYCKVVIEIIDINDNAPEFIFEPYRIALPIVDVYIGETVFTPTIFDADSNDSVTLSIASGDSEAIFGISANNSIIVMRPSLLSRLPAENNFNKFNLTLRAADNKKLHTTFGTLIIDLINSSRHVPHFEQQHYRLHISRREIILAKPILKIRAEMPMTTLALPTATKKSQHEMQFYPPPTINSALAAVNSARLHYVLDDDAEDDSFELDFDTGALTIVRQPPIQSSMKRQLMVKAILHTDASVYARVPVTVTVDDDDQHSCCSKPLEFSSPYKFLQIDEEPHTLKLLISFDAKLKTPNDDTNRCLNCLPIEYFIERVQILRKNRQLEFAQEVAPHCYRGQLQPPDVDPKHWFHIDPKTGDLYVQNSHQALDYDKHREVVVTIGAMAPGVAGAAANFATLHLKLRNLNDNPPCFIRQAPYEFYFDAASRSNFVGVVSAIDADDDDDVGANQNSLGFSIDSNTNANETFRIDKTGTIRLNRPIFDAGTVELNVSVTDGVHLDFIGVKIHYTDSGTVDKKNQFPTFERDYYTISLPAQQNLPAGSVIAQVGVKTSPTPIIAYNILATSSNTSLFTIDNVDGRVVTRASWPNNVGNSNEEDELVLPITLTIQAINAAGYSAYTKLILIAASVPSQNMLLKSSSAVTTPRVEIFDLEFYELSIPVPSSLTNGTNTKFIHNFVYNENDENIVYSMACLEMACDSMPVHINAHGQLEMPTTASTMSFYVGKTFSFTVEAAIARGNGQQQQHHDSARVMVHIVDGNTARVPVFRNADASNSIKLFMPEELAIGSEVDSNALEAVTQTASASPNALKIITQIKSTANDALDAVTLAKTPMRYDIIPGQQKFLPFSINARTGRLIVTRRLDFDDKRNRADGDLSPIYEFGVRAQVVGEPQWVNYARVRVVLTDINDNAPRFMHDALTAYVPEEDISEPLIITRVEARDRDSGENGRISYRIQQIDGEGDSSLHYDSSMQDLMPFVIDAQTGTLRTRPGIQLDRERTRRVVVTVEARDAGQPISRVAQTNVTVNVVDSNDNSPYFLSTDENFNVILTKEQMLPLSTILTLPVADPDEASTLAAYVTFPNEKISPMLAKVVAQSDGQYNIALELVTPITVTRPDMLMTVTLTDGRFVVVKNFTVQIKNADYNVEEEEFCPPVPVQTALISELEAIGTVVFNAAELSPAPLSVCGGNSDDPKFALAPTLDARAFSIDARTGIIRLQRALDAEQQQKYNLSVQISKQGFVLLVEIVDENDSAPQLTALPPNNTLLVSQSELKSSWPMLVLGKLRARDADIRRENRHVSFSLTNVDAETDLSKQLLNIDSKTGVLSMQQQQSNTRRLQWPLIISTSENFAPLRVAVKLSNDDNDNKNEQHLRRPRRAVPAPSVTILTLRPTTNDDHVDLSNGRNDVPAMFTRLSYDISVAENTPIGTELMRFNTTTNNAAGCYIAEQQRDTIPFTLDRRTCALTVSRTLDFESENEFNFEIFAGTGAEASVGALVHVGVTDVNDNAPIFVQTSYIFNISEDAHVGVQVGVVHAFDADSGENGRISYFLLPEDGKNISLAFKIDEKRGSIILASPVDREQKSLYNLRVIAKDHGSPPTPAAGVPIEIRILDVNDNAPVCRNTQQKLFFMPNADDGSSSLRARLRRRSSRLEFVLDIFDADDVNSGNAAPFIAEILKSDGDDKNAFEISQLVGVNQKIGVALRPAVAAAAANLTVFRVPIRVRDNGGLQTVCVYSVELVRLDTNTGDDDEDDTNTNTNRLNPSEILIQLISPEFDDEIPSKIGLVKLIEKPDTNSNTESNSNSRRTLVIDGAENAQKFYISSTNALLSMATPLPRTSQHYALNISSASGDGAGGGGRHTPVTIHFLPPLAERHVSHFGTLLTLQSIDAREFAANHQNSFRQVLAEIFGLKRWKHVKILSILTTTTKNNFSSFAGADSAGGVQVLFLLQRVSTADSTAKFIDRQLVEHTLRNVRNRAKFESATGLVVTRVGGGGQCSAPCGDENDENEEFHACIVSSIKVNRAATQLDSLRLTDDKFLAFSPISVESACECTELGVANGACRPSKSGMRNDTAATASHGVAVHYNGNSFSAVSHSIRPHRHRLEQHYYLTLELEIRSSNSNTSNHQQTIFSRQQDSELSIDVNGFCEYRFECGGGKTAVARVTNVLVNDGQWHTIRVERRGQHATLIVDGKNKATASILEGCGGAAAAAAVQSQNENLFYFGAGVLEPNDTNPTTTNGFVGCMKRVTIENFQPFDQIFNPTAFQFEVEKLYNTKFGCENLPFVGADSAKLLSSRDCRTSDGCQNNGICIRNHELGGGGGFVCQCNTSKFWGTFCEHALVYNTSSSFGDDAEFSKYFPHKHIIAKIHAYTPKIVIDTLSTVPMEIIVAGVAVVVFFTAMLMLCCCWVCCCRKCHHNSGKREKLKNSTSPSTYRRAARHDDSEENDSEEDFQQQNQRRRRQKRQRQQKNVVASRQKKPTPRTLAAPPLPVVNGQHRATSSSSSETSAMTANIALGLSPQPTTAVGVGGVGVMSPRAIHNNIVRSSRNNGGVVSTINARRGRHPLVAIPQQIDDDDENNSSNDEEIDQLPSLKNRQNSSRRKLLFSSFRGKNKNSSHEKKSKKNLSSPSKSKKIEIIPGEDYYAGVRCGRGADDETTSTAFIGISKPNSNLLAGNMYIRSKRQSAAAASAAAASAMVLRKKQFTAADTSFPALSSNNRIESIELCQVHHHHHEPIHDENDATQALLIPDANTSAAANTTDDSRSGVPDGGRHEYDTTSSCGGGNGGPPSEALKKRQLNSNHLVSVTDGVTSGIGGSFYWDMHDLKQQQPELPAVGKNSSNESLEAPPPPLGAKRSKIQPPNQLQLVPSTLSQQHLLLLPNLLSSPPRYIQRHQPNQQHSFQLQQVPPPRPPKPTSSTTSTSATTSETTATSSSSASASVSASVSNSPATNPNTTLTVITEHQQQQPQLPSVSSASTSSTCRSSTSPPHLITTTTATVAHHHGTVNGHEDVHDGFEYDDGDSQEEQTSKNPNLLSKIRNKRTSDYLPSYRHLLVMENGHGDDNNESAKNRRKSLPPQQQLKAQQNGDGDFDDATLELPPPPMQHKLQSVKSLNLLRQQQPPPQQQKSSYPVIKLDVNGGRVLLHEHERRSSSSPYENMLNTNGSSTTPAVTTKKNSVGTSV